MVEDKTGTIDKIKGRANQAIGGVTGDEKQQLRGKAQEVKGDAKGKINRFQNAMETDEDM